MEVPEPSNGFSSGWCGSGFRVEGLELKDERLGFRVQGFILPVLL